MAVEQAGDQSMAGYTPHFPKCLQVVIDKAKTGNGHCVIKGVIGKRLQQRISLKVVNIPSLCFCKPQGYQVRVNSGNRQAVSGKATTEIPGSATNVH